MPNISDKFVLFAEARSGSSNLLRVLQLHPQLHIAEEPFMRKYPIWNPGEPNYLERIVDIASLEEQLAELFAKFEGIKVQNYQLPEVLYTHLLLRPDLKIIALRRRNVLQQAVSGCIAEQTGIWKIWDLHGDLATAYQGLRPIDLQTLAENIAYRHELAEFYAGILAKKSPAMCLSLLYEDLFTADMARNRESVRIIFHFLGLTMPEGASLDALIDPQQSKINSAQTYALLPNAHDIDAQFGSAENGWLFDPHKDNG